MFTSLGNNPDSWAAGLMSSDFQLICPQGSKAEAKDYKRCNLARVPSHAVMVRPDTNIHALYGLLDEAQVGNASICSFKMMDIFPSQSHTIHLIYRFKKGYSYEQ